VSILDTILGRQNKTAVPVPTPEWSEYDGKLGVRRLTPIERAEFYVIASKEKPEPGIQFQSLVAAYCTVFDGQRAFADADWRALSNDPGSGACIERLSDAADEANILSDGARESLKKKYETAPDSGNNSASPEKKESATPSS
jgi:hypothetical protein